MSTPGGWIEIDPQWTADAAARSHCPRYRGECKGLYGAVRYMRGEALRAAGVPPPGHASQWRCDSSDATSTRNRSQRRRLNTCFQRPGGRFRTAVEEGLGVPTAERVKIRLWEYVLTYKDVTGTGCRKVLQLQKICSWPSYEEKGAFGGRLGSKVAKTKK